MSQQLVHKDYCYICVKKFGKKETVYNYGHGNFCKECKAKKKRKLQNNVLY